VLVGAAELEGVLRDVDLPADDRNESGRLAFIPSGPLPPNPSELLASTQMTALLDRVGAQFDYVLIDSPPVLLVADALELARDADGVIVVVRHGHASTDEARELRATVERLGLNLVGAVMTDVEPVRQYGAYGDQPARRQRRGRRPEQVAPANDEVF
jgi:Mrp family chromosome partitioning ATPase